MFNKVISNLGQSADPAPSSPSKVKPNAKAVSAFVPETVLQAGAEFGTNLLISNGLLSPKIMVKLQKHRPNPEVIRITTALDLKNLQLARDLALDRNFIESNEIFVKSGQAVKTAIEKGFMEFAWELVKNQYTLPRSLIVEGIQSSNKPLVTNTIEGQFYTKEDHVELDFWYLLHQGMLEEAKKLYTREPLLQRFRADLDSPDEIRRLLIDEELATSALRIALTEGHDSIASIIIGLAPNLILKDMLPLALDKSCIEFLKKVWTGHHHFKEGDEIKRRKRTSPLWEALEKNIESRDDLKQLTGSLKLSYIIDKLLEKKLVMEAASVLSWPGAANEIGVVKVLVQHGQQDLARGLLRMNTVGVSAHDFDAAFKARQFDLCVEMMSFKEARVALDDLKVQMELIRMTELGDTCLQAIEMMNRITTKNWHMELTKDLCSTLSTFAKKSNELVVCTSPLLFCALTAEFFTKLASASLQHETRCLTAADVFLNLGLQVELAMKDEQELKYALMERDSRSYTVLTILSKNRFYSLLEHDEIGTIVSKMWVGARRNYGILGASTIANSFHFPAGSEESMQFSKRLDSDKQKETDKAKPYMFHFEQWTESCNNRFLGQAFCTLMHVILYQMVIYTAISDNAFMDVAQSDNAVVYLRIAQVWVLAIAVEHGLHMLFGIKTGRGYEIDNWRVLDYIMFVVTILLMVGLHQKYMGEGKALSTWNPELFNASLHSIMMTIIWIRFTSVLITTKRFGPFLRMIFLILQKCVSYFVIWGSLMICTAAVFTALFHDNQANWGNFSLCLRSLVSAYLGQFHMWNFDTNIALGGVLLGFFLLIANVMMLNLLVAVLTNVSMDLSERVDSEHRAVVVSFYNRWNWHDLYGVLIFLPPPFTLVSALAVPLLVVGGGSMRLNEILSQIFYIFYAIPQYMVFLLGTLCYLPLMYIKGFAVYGKSVRIRKLPPAGRSVGAPSSESNADLTPGLSQQIRAQRTHTLAQMNLEADRTKKETFSLVRCFLWTAIGLPWLLWALVRDSYDFWVGMYKSTYIEAEENDKTKVEQLLTEKFITDLQLVLKSISAKEVTANQMVEMWIMVEQSNINTDIIVEDEFETSTAERKEAARDLFLQFANPSADNIINIERMKRMMPRKLGHVYTMEYLETVRHVNVPWMSKAIKKFQELVGSMTIGGVAIPKTVSSANQSDIDQQSLKSLHRSMKELTVKYNDFLATSGGIRAEMEEQLRTLKALRVRLRKD